MRRILCFHNPDEQYGWLSNWFASPFTIGGIRFSMVEQYMMYQKAVLFGDMGSAGKILAENNAAMIKQYGRQVAGYSELIWNGNRQIVVYKGLLAKFSQNGDLCKMLQETEDAVLAECAVQDRIWGIGLSMKNPDRFCIENWNGKNLLGFALMQVREQLRS